MKLPLVNGGHALIDESDYAQISKTRWRWRRFGRSLIYVVDPNGTLMHRMILGLNKRGPHVDHRNCDGLDNRRSNLRIATTTQNQQNARARLGGLSRFKGVCRQRNRNGHLSTWRAYISINKAKIHIGSFPTEELAARAYDAVAMEEFGEFARLNFLNEIDDLRAQSS